MQRVILVILVTFWAFMTYRLWQVEYAGQSLGAAVDIQVVWEKILNAQDEAKLQIVDERSNHLLGALDWTPTVQRETEDDERANIVGMVENVREYTLDISRGRLYSVRSQEDLLFDFNLNLAPNLLNGVEILLKSLLDRLLSPTSFISFGVLINKPNINLPSVPEFFAFIVRFFL